MGRKLDNIKALKKSFDDSVVFKSEFVKNTNNFAFGNDWSSRERLTVVCNNDKILYSIDYIDNHGIELDKVYHDFNLTEYNNIKKMELILKDSIEVGDITEACQGFYDTYVLCVANFMLTPLSNAKIQNIEVRENDKMLCIIVSDLVKCTDEIFMVMRNDL